MSYFIPASNNYFGFMPVSVGAQHGNFSMNSYLVSSSEGAISAGDVCVQTSLNTVRPLTSAGGVTNFTSSMAYVGVAAHAMVANTGSTAALIGTNSTQMIILYDSPSQVFAVCDTTSGVIGSQTGIWKNYALLTTGATGSTGPFQSGTINARSNVALSGVTSTVAGVFHVIGLHPVEGGIHSTVGAATAGSAINVRKWLGTFVSGVQVIPSTGLLTIANTTS